jgi:hypothetical protein
LVKDKSQYFEGKQEIFFTFAFRFAQVPAYDRQACWIQNPYLS